ncbi:MAG TPA: hypothetical protein VIQ31_21065 [Phormidium sp.]
MQISGTDVTTLLTQWISEYVSGVEVKPTAGIDQLIAIKVEQSLKPIISEMTVIKNKLSFLEEKHQDYEKLRRQVEVMEKSFQEISQSLGIIAQTRTTSSEDFEKINNKLQQLEFLYQQQNSKGTKNHSPSKKGFGHL